MSIQLQRTRGWRMCLPAAALTIMLVGCSVPGKRFWKRDKPITAASYQVHPIVEAPKKVKDPVSLKLRYAKWMEEIENYELAQENYNIVLQERPEDIEAILGLARIDEVAGRLDAAETGFKKALQLQPDSAVAMNALGQHYVARDRLTEALPLLNKAMLADPANKSYRFHLATALARSGDTRTAYSHFVQSVGEPTAHYNIAMVLRSQGHYAQAEQHLLQAITQKPDFEPAKQALTQVRRQARAAGTYASRQQPSPQIRPTGHSRPGTIAAPQQGQSRYRR